MKILFLNRVAAPVEGGMNQYVLDVAARLRTAGETVALVHARNPPSQFHGTGYVFDHLDQFTPDSHEVFVRLEAILEDFQPDLVQLHGVSNAALLPWLAKRLPTVQFVHNHRYYCSGGDMTWRRPRRLCHRPHGRSCLVNHAACGCGTGNPARTWMRFRAVGRELAALRTLRGIQVASPVIRENLERNGIDPARITLLPLYAPEPADERRPMAVGRRMVLHVGGLLKKKGAWLMLRGLDRLPPDVELVFAGGGELESELCGEIHRRGLGGRVRVMGELDPHGWSALLHQVTLVVMPSRWNEPLGLPGLQAMAHGKAVVAFRSEGVAGWLQDGVNGVTVPFNNAPAFLRAVRELLDTPPRLTEMGRRGLDLWKDQFQPATHITRLRKYYRRITSEPPSA